ncbi:MAG: hypothetical protein M1565_07455, partial [Actinobacteria bacterium]|nr:hypothetical protein [Actinomycetota bacterium]
LDSRDGLYGGIEDRRQQPHRLQYRRRVILPVAAAVCSGGSRGINAAESVTCSGGANREAVRADRL